jgi:HNH endonuclease
MAVKKIYSDYQINKSDEIRGWQLRIAQLKSLNDDYYIAQRDVYNKGQKDQWNNEIERIKKYTHSYNFTIGLAYRKLKNLERFEFAMEYFKKYSIHEITGNEAFAHASGLWMSAEQPELDKILDPKNIKLPDEPIPIYDLQHFKEPVEKQIREFECKIEKIKTDTANAILTSQHKPIPLEDSHRWLYQDSVYEVTGEHSDEENVLLILDFVGKDRRKFERLKNKFSGKQSEELKYERVRIPEEVRIAVWRRDQGRCARCGSRENLEYDHIVPVSKGGGNTERNIELLCQDCNRSKGNRIE